MLFFAAVFLGSALTTVAAVWPLLLRRVPPNRVYGLRVKATYADEWVWYEANAACARDMLRCQLVQVATAVVPPLFLRPDSWSSLSLDRTGVVYLALNLGVCLVGLFGELRRGGAAR